MPIQEAPGTAKAGSVSTAFLPTSIGGCQLWMDAADTSASSMTLSGSTVTVWKDKSGNGNATTTKIGSPIQSAQGITITSSDNFYMDPITNPPTGSYLTFFIVATLVATGGSYGRLVSFGKQSDGTANNDFSTSPNFIVCQAGTNQQISIYRNGGPQFTQNVTYGTRFLLSIVWDGTNETPYFNGTSLGSLANSGNFGFNRLGLGVNINTKTYPNDCWAGTMSEILMYYSAFTTTDRQTIEGYLAQKWGLTASLPAGHPGLTNTYLGSGSTIAPFRINSIARPNPVLVITEQVYVPSITIGSINFVQTGSAQYATVPANAGFNFGTGNFTIEGWFYCPNVSNGANQDMMVMQNGSAYMIIGISANAGMRVNYNDTPTTGSPFNQIVMPAGTVVANTWTHFCAMRNGNTYSFFLNGKCVGSISGISAAQMGSAALPWYLGSDAGSNRFTGNLACIRIVNGSLVYSYGTTVGTTYFTTPTSAPTKIAGTQLLLLFSGPSTFLQDTSSNGSTLTNTGGSTYSALKPF